MKRLNEVKQGRKRSESEGSSKPPPLDLTFSEVMAMNKEEQAEYFQKMKSVSPTSPSKRGKPIRRKKEGYEQCRQCKEMISMVDSPREEEHFKPNQFHIKVPLCRPCYRDSIIRQSFYT